jgi:hypothetical protein
MALLSYIFPHLQYRRKNILEVDLDRFIHAVDITAFQTGALSPLRGFLIRKRTMPTERPPLVGEI